MKHVDCMIIGGGLAGCLLARELQQNNFSVHMFDKYKANSASRVAIGLVNPITGKRLVKSWLIDQLIPVAKQTYKNIEEEFSSQFLFDTTIARIIPNTEIFEQWKQNFDSAVADGYISPSLKCMTINSHQFEYFEILNAFWVDVNACVKAMTEQNKQRQQFTDTDFEYDRLQIKHHVVYDKIRADRVIFCDGAQGRNNPFFAHLPFNVNKGEVAQVSMPDFNFSDTLKKNIFLLPTQHGHTIGSTYNREFGEDETPNQDAIQYFTEKLNELGLTGKFSNLKAGVRPSTTDRRPFIGPHHSLDKVFIFNGFGAKGVSLIPFFAKQFVGELQGKETVNKEASTRRFFV